MKEHTGVGKFYIVYDNGEESHLLSCGNTTESIIFMVKVDLFYIQA